jgi:hypothetical protein
LLILQPAHSLRSSADSLGILVLRGMEPLAEDFVNYRTRAASRLPKRKKIKSCANKTKRSRFFEIALVLVRLDHIARFIVNTNHSMM